jgi:hypothetical protein
MRNALRADFEQTTPAAAPLLTKEGNNFSVTAKHCT